MTELTAETVQIGWQVVDPDGNVIQSGPVVIAEMSGELAEMLGIDLEE
jgi:hypothetical protein